MSRREFVFGIPLLVSTAIGLDSALSQTSSSSTFEMVSFKPPVPAPKFTLNDLAGASRTIGPEGPKKFTLLNFWATWCPPCVHELPSLQSLHDTMDQERFSLLAVSVDIEANTPRIFEFRDKYGLKFPIAQDANSEIANNWGVRQFPSTFLVGPRGDILAAAKGERVWHSKAAIGYFNSVVENYE